MEGYRDVLMDIIEAQVEFVNHLTVIQVILIPNLRYNNHHTLSSNILYNSSPHYNHRQQGQPLYNPNQVIACLNHVLVDRMVAVGITPNLLVLNNTKGVGPELN